MTGDRLAGSGSYFAINYEGSTTDVKITRDKDGLITSTVDASGTTTNVYYPSQWLKTKTVSAGTSKTLTYEYNGVGAVSKLTIPGGGYFDYGYNSRNLLDSVTNPDSVQISFSYDNGGRRTDVTRPGSTIHYGYNARDWITAVQNRAGGVTRYDASYYYNDGALWDHTGNPLKRVETSAAGTFTTTLRYDNVYRLSEETLRDSGGVTQYTHTYAYDAVGNRTTRNDGGARSLGHFYDANNRLTSTRWVGGGQAPGPITANFYYDGAGNMTSVTGTEFGAWTLEYDDDSRPVTITSPSSTDTFVWNALGQRMRATLNGTVYRYVYAGSRVLEETTDAGGLVARYSLEGGSYYAPWVATYLAGVGARFPLMDGVGTTRRLVTSGNTAWDQYSLDAFGADRGSWTNYHNPYRFGGAWGYITDTPGSGLLQLGARFYWPELGRFITQDPLRVRWNRYAYAGSNPILRIDPKGLKDIYFPLEADVATPWGGIEASVGIVIDTDDWLHESGVFSSSGPAKGPNFGLGGGAGVAEEIEGYVDSVDVDFALLSVSWPFEEDWRDARGVAVTIGPGAGASVSHTVTRTTTLPCIWASLQRAGRWLRDLF